MTDRIHLIEDLHAQARGHVRLATMADVPPVAEMHIDLAIFCERQARDAEQMCEDGEGSSSDNLNPFMPDIVHGHVRT